MASGQYRFQLDGFFRGIGEVDEVERHHCSVTNAGRKIIGNQASSKELESATPGGEKTQLAYALVLCRDSISVVARHNRDQRQMTRGSMRQDGGRQSGEAGPQPAAGRRA